MKLKNTKASNYKDQIEILKIIGLKLAQAFKDNIAYKQRERKREREWKWERGIMHMNLCVWEISMYFTYIEEKFYKGFSKFFYGDYGKFTNYS